MASIPTILPIKEFEQSRQDFLLYLKQRNKRNPVFSKLPSDICHEIFSYFNIQAFAKCCLLSGSCYKLISLRGRKMFIFAAKCLGADRNDSIAKEYFNTINLVRIHPMPLISSQSKFSPYCLELNHRIPKLRVLAKFSEAILSTKGLDFKFLENIIDIKKIFEGIRAKMMLSRIELGSWNSIIQPALQLESNTFKASIDLLWIDIFNELNLQNQTHEAKKIFEDHLLPQDDQETLVSGGKIIIKNLCKEKKFTEASDFFKVHFSEGSESIINEMISLIVLPAIKEKEYGLAENLLSWSSGDNLITALCTLIDEHEDKNRSAQLIATYLQTLSEWLSIQLCAADNIDSDLYTQVLNVIPSSQFSDFVNLCIADIIIRDELINKALGKLWTIGTITPIIQLLTDALFDQCEVIDEQTLALGLRTTYLADEFIVEIAQKCPRISNLKTFLSWQRSSEIVDMLIDKFNPNNSNWLRDAIKSKLTDDRLILIMEKCCDSSLHFGGYLAILVRYKRSVAVFIALIKKCGPINPVELDRALYYRLNDFIILCLIRKLDTYASLTLYRKELGLFYHSSTQKLSLSDTFSYLKKLMKDRNPKLEKALSHKYQNTCKTM